MDLEIALEFVNQIFEQEVGRNLRPPEITIFRGTWQGITYEQMAESCSYSANYLMRDIAPKFWKLLSKIFDTNIGKSNLRIKLCKLYDSSQVQLAETVADKPGNLGKNWENSVASPSVFYGRSSELETLHQWLLNDRCQLIKLWGLSGAGKTLLMKKIGEQIQGQYEVVIWRSLDRNPTLNELVVDILHSGFDIVEKNTVQLLPKLMEQMRSHSCLIMLDGIETMLKTQELSGQYRADYEDYANFCQLIGESSHQSCVIITSLENFGRIMLANNDNSAIKSLKLSGLSTSEAQTLFTRELGASNISNSSQHLIEYYQGNPAILSFAAQMIHQLFNGNIQEFVEQRSLVFGEINHLLNRSFERLSTLEVEILYWLASESQPISLSEIQNDVPFSIYPVELIEALESLNQRSLIAINQIQDRSVFSLSPMIREFVINQFIAQIGGNFSLENRQKSWLTNNTIELGNITKIIHLSQWVQNRFESGWQPVEKLFTQPQESPSRLRSVFNLRGEVVVKRFKQIHLGRSELTILLLIAISQGESTLKICVQVQPDFNQQTLPVDLKLSLLDPNNTVLAKIVSEPGVSFIQLPCFQGEKNEKFTVEIKIDSINYLEEFLI